jgi:Putative DNA-binding domain
MPTLLELQHAMRRSLVLHDDEAVSLLLADDVARDRLDIYRNTIASGLTKTLRLSFPAVERLVGADFFDGAARRFIVENPPRAAYLDRYGGEFPDFLRDFPPAASLAYLADVARLEWAVNCAIHAPDVETLELAELAAVAPDDQGRVSFVAHPAVRLLRADYPADDIWRAVLAGDDGALTSLDVDAGPVHLLVERRATGVEVVRLDKPAWRFVAELCAGRSLQSALERAGELDSSTALAEHLAVGRFAGFRLTTPEAMSASHEAAAWG